MLQLLEENATIFIFSKLCSGLVYIVLAERKKLWGDSLMIYWDRYAYAIAK